MKDEKRIKQIAKQLAELERKCQKDKNNINIYLEEMDNLTKNLSLEEILEIDEYILENVLLKK